MKWANAGGHRAKDFLKNGETCLYLRGCGLALSAPEAVPRVSGFAPVPSLFIIQMFKVELALGVSLPSRARLEQNNIVLPPDDHRG